MAGNRREKAQKSESEEKILSVVLDLQAMAPRSRNNKTWLCSEAVNREDSKGCNEVKVFAGSIFRRGLMPAPIGLTACKH
jgi:hypothetical protein